MLWQSLGRGFGGSIKIRLCFCQKSLSCVLSFFILKKYLCVFVLGAVGLTESSNFGKLDVFEFWATFCLKSAREKGRYGGKAKEQVIHFKCKRSASMHQNNKYLSILYKQSTNKRSADVRHPRKLPTLKAVFCPGAQRTMHTSNKLINSILYSVFHILSCLVYFVLELNAQCAFRITW